MKAKIKRARPKFPCDNCGTPFEIKIKENFYTNGAGTSCVYWNFKCPHCRINYVPYSGRVK